MRVVNSSFHFTVKVGADHFGGQFNYIKNNSELVKLSFHKLPQQCGNGFAYEQVNYLRKVEGKWILWDINRHAPKYNSEHDRATYAIFREAFGLSLLDEA